MTERDTVIAWLRDAFAMETAVEQILANHAKDAGDDLRISRRYEEHLRDTREQADSIRVCLEANGEKTSGGKTLLGNLIGKVQAISTGAAEDELVKNLLTDYAIEHFEIACYKSLIAAAERAGMEEVAAICQGILAEEEEMADWVGHQIPLITEQFMDQREARRKEEDQPRRRAAGG